MTKLPDMPNWHVGLGRLILVGFSLLVGSIVSMSIHEAAHTLAGVCAGFSFRALRVGPLQFDQRFRISLYRSWSIVTSGWTEMIPIEGDSLAWRAVIVFCAGPVANLLSVCAVFILPFSMGLFSYSFVIVSLFQGIVNLLPLQNGAEITDGMRILMLLRSQESRHRLVALAKLANELKKGVMPEALSPDSLAEAIVLKDNSPDTVQAYAFAFAAASSKNDDAKAAVYLETCLQFSSYAPPHIQHALMSAAGIFQARKRKRVDLAEQWLATMPGKTEIPWLRANVEAAILEAKGDIEGALTKLDAAERLMLAVPDRTEREVARRSLLRWKSELMPRVTAAPRPEKQGPQI